MSEFEPAFEAMVSDRVDALIIATDTFFYSEMGLLQGSTGGAKSPLPSRIARNMVLSHLALVLLSGRLSMLLRIRFPDKSSREQSLLVSELQSVIAPAVETAGLVKESEATQDPGTILTIVLGAPAVVGAVTAIGAWLVRKNQRVIIKNMKSEDVAAAVKAIQTRPKQGA